MSDGGLIDAIKAVNCEVMDAFDKQYATAVSMFYTEDCKLMPPGSDVVNGRRAVADVFEGLMKDGATKYQLNTEEVEPLSASDMCYERGYSIITIKGVENHGKYVVIWKKVEGKWLLYTDIFNSSPST